MEITCQEKSRVNELLGKASIINEIANHDPMGTFMRYYNTGQKRTYNRINKIKGEQLVLGTSIIGRQYNTL